MDSPNVTPDSYGLALQGWMLSAYVPLLPPGIQREISSALDRTGWTPALTQAVRVLSKILPMSPQDFDSYSAPIYQRSDM